MTLLWLPVLKNHTKWFVLIDGGAPEGNGFLASDTTSGEFKHSERGTRREGVRGLLIIATSVLMLV